MKVIQRSSGLVMEAEQFDPTDRDQHRRLKLCLQDPRGTKFIIMGLFGFIGLNPGEWVVRPKNGHPGVYTQNEYDTLFTAEEAAP